MRCGSAQLPDGSLVGGKILDPTGVGRALKQLLVRTDITGQRALVAASDSGATFRVLQLAPSATHQEVEAEVAREIVLDPERMATGWVDVPNANPDRRLVYAAGWDRSVVPAVSQALEVAGVEPVVVELKSASVARTVQEPSCIVLDMATNPIEIFLIDEHVPQLWHAFELKADRLDDLASALAGPLRSVLRFYKRGREAGLAYREPVLISGEQALPAQMLTSLSEMIDQPVAPLPLPPRVPAHVRHATYLACLGLLMRRS